MSRCLWFCYKPSPIQGNDPAVIHGVYPVLHQEGIKRPPGEHRLKKNCKYHVRIVEASKEKNNKI